MSKQCLTYILFFSVLFQSAQPQSLTSYGLLPVLMWILL